MNCNLNSNINIHVYITKLMFQIKRRPIDLRSFSLEILICDTIVFGSVSICFVTLSDKFRIITVLLKLGSGIQCVHVLDGSFTFNIIY